MGRKLVTLLGAVSVAVLAIVAALAFTANMQQHPANVDPTEFRR